MYNVIHFFKVKEILQEEEDLSEIVQLVGKVSFTSFHLESENNSFLSITNCVNTI